MGAGQLIDISVPLQEGIPIWPGSVGVRVSRTMLLEEGDPANVTRLDFDVHVGTHVEAALHFIAGGQGVDDIPLDVLIGPARVAYVPGSTAIGAAGLEDLGLPAGTARLLLRTRNSDLWNMGRSGFVQEYVGLSTEGARWVVDRGIQLIGIDYLSVAAYSEVAETHRILMSSGITILEGLNLAGVPPGAYELICLPMKLANAEGAPARAVLRALS